MFFRDLIGRSAISEQLLRLLDSRRFPHAVIISGASGYGTLALARALAARLLCEQADAGDACGLCDACRRTAVLEHPDLHLSFPCISPKSGAPALTRYFVKAFRELMVREPYAGYHRWLEELEAQRANISADECREIISGLSLAPAMGKARVQIIWMADRLDREGNILLKLIEEPPPGTYLIMLAEDPDSMLATIRSRTQLFRLPPPEEAALRDALIQAGADPQIAMSLVRTSEGNIGEALSRLKGSGQNLLPQLRDWFNAAALGNAPALSKLTEEWSKLGRDELNDLLRYAAQMVGEGLRSSVTGIASPEPEEARFSAGLTRMGLGPDAAGMLVGWIGESLTLISGNAHVKTVLLALSIRISALLRGRTIPGT